MEKSRSVILAALLLAFLTGTASSAGPCDKGGIAIGTAPWYCNTINGTLQNVWITWAPFVFMAIFVSFSFAAIIFMAGLVFRIERIRNFAVGELYEATATTLIAVMFMSLSAVLFGLIPAVTTGPVNPYVTALSYISSTIDVTSRVITSVYNVALIDFYYGSISVSVSVKGNGVPGAVSDILTSLTFAIYALFLIPARSILYLFSDGLLILHAQFYLLLYFMYTAIPVFLVPGIIFRSIFPLRTLGGIMIAIAIVFYMILPTLFSVAYYFTNTGLVGTLGSLAQQIQAHGQGTLAETNAASSTAPLVQDVQQVQNAMGGYWLSILFYPALIMAIGYESIKIISNLIGGAVKTTGKLTHL